jgi:hypothetical protein
MATRWQLRDENRGGCTGFSRPGVFVWLRSAALPPRLASHFSASGAADGFMPRSTYVALMAAIAVGMPLLVAAAGRRVDVLPEQGITLPNRDHRLAPSRRARTLAFVRPMLTAFAALLALFLCVVHGLVGGPRRCIRRVSTTPPSSPAWPRSGRPRCSGRSPCWPAFAIDPTEL